MFVSLRLELSNLCRLESLRDLRVVDYRIVPGQMIDVSSLKLQHLSRFEFRNKVSSVGADHWVPLLPHNGLHELEITLTASLVDAFHLVPSFPQTRKLSVTLDVLNAPKNTGLLSKFPALEVLSMSQANARGGGDNTIGVGLSAHAPPPALPHLREYTGIYQTLPMFLSLPTLTHLTIDYCHPHQLIVELKEIQTPAINVKSLCVNFVSSPDALFNELFGGFRALTRLRINVCDMLELDFDFNSMVMDDPVDVPDWKIPQLLEALRKSSLPPHLEQLAIFWKIEDDSLSPLPNFKQFSRRLMRKFPTLTTVWLGLYGLTCCSRKMPDGTVAVEEAVADENHGAIKPIVKCVPDRQRSLTSTETVKRMCKDFNSSWGEMETQV
ncbi:hypothetical protein B0H11DRAFT_1995510 [Mycena galericulata]|nr:hypothetical protein B0H11DRAFT_1995510 [Mycena galericulata]